MYNDPFSEQVQKSLISHTIANARQALMEPARPATPKDPARHLFEQNEYSSRPGSSYSLGQVAAEGAGADTMPVRRVTKLPAFDTAVVTERMQRLELATSRFAVKPSTAEKVVKGSTAETITQPSDQPQPAADRRAPRPASASHAADTSTIPGLVHHLVRSDIADGPHASDSLTKLCRMMLDTSYSAAESGGDSVRVLGSIPQLFAALDTLPELAVQLATCLTQCLVIANACVSASTLLATAIKVLFKYSKNPANDPILYKLDVPQTIHQALEGVLDHTNIQSNEVQFDLLIYIVGLMKNCSASSTLFEGMKITPSIMILARMLPMAFVMDPPEGFATSKRAQLLIQVTGTLRNLAEVPDALPEFKSLFVIERVLATLQIFKGHKELALNCSRFISKLSPDESVCLKLTDLETLELLISLIDTYSASTAILERVLYTLANIVSTQPVAREVLTDSCEINELVYVNIVCGHANDVEMVKKGYRLLANLALNCAHEAVASVAGRVIPTIIETGLDESDQDMCFLCIACLCNYLFYDTTEAPIISDEVRVDVTKALSFFIAQTYSEDICLEALRCLSNLTRHDSVCRFLPKLHIQTVLLFQLESSNQNIVYFTLGTLTNVSRKVKDVIYKQEFF